MKTIVKTTGQAILAVALFLVAIQSALAASNIDIHLAAEYRDSSNSLYTGTKAITYKLYYASSGGVAVYTNATTETILGGVLNIQLDNITGVDWSNDVYLGITVTGSSEMTPRIKLTSSADSANNPFTFNGTAAGTKNTVSSATLPNTTINGSLNVTQNIWQNGVLVCLSNGTNCPTANANVTAGYGISITAGQINVSATTCTASEASRWTGSAFQCVSIAAGTGDITAVLTVAGDYIYNGTTNGDVLLLFNETKLNETINSAAALALQNNTIARTGNCPAGQAVQNTTTNGVQCITVGNGNASGTVTQIDTGAFMLGGPITATGTISFDASSFVANTGNFSANASTWSTCGAGQVSKWNGAALTCVSDADTTYTVGYGLLLTSTQINISATTCGAGEFTKWNGTNFTCATPSGSGDLTDVLQGTGIIVSDQGGPQPSVALNTTYLNNSYVEQSEYANLDTDSTNDLTTATSWGGDLSGTGTSPEVRDNSHQLDWANITNKPTVGSGTSNITRVQSPNGSIIATYNATDVNLTVNGSWLDSQAVLQGEYANLDTDSTNDLTTSTVFANTTGGNVNITGTYNSLVLYANCVAITGSSELCDGSDAGTGGGMTAWTLSNGSTTESITDTERVNITAGRNITITQVGAQLVINAIDTDTDTDTNGYTVECSISGTTTKTAQCSRNGMANFSYTWTDLDTDTDTWNTTAQMQAATNNTLTALAVACGNITGASSNLCTIVDTNTQYTNGSGLSLVGTQFNHSDTSTQSSSDNSGRTYIQDITLDDFGHITGILTATETIVDTNSGGNMSIFTVAANGNTSTILNATTINLKNGTGTSVTLTSSAGVVNISFHLNNTGTSGTYGSATQVPVFTTDSQGRVTSVTNTAITFPAGGSGTSNISVFNSPNGSVIITYNSTHVNITVNGTWLDSQVVLQGEYPNLDTDSTNDLTTSTAFLNASGDVNVTGTYNALVLEANCVSITGSADLCDGSDATGSSYTNGSGLSLVGTQFNHTDTSTQASSDNSGRTYIQDLTIDGFGHITGLVTATETVVDTNSGGVSNYTSFVSPNGSIILTTNGSQVNATINGSWLDTQVVMQGEYPSLDTDSTNDLSTSTSYSNASTSRINVTGGYNSLVLTIAANNLTGDDILESSLGTVPTATSASTATALAADPANCAAGSSAAGITAGGVAEGCQDTLNTSDTAAGEVSGVFGNLVVGNDVLDDQYIELGDVFNNASGDVNVTGTYGALVLEANCVAITGSAALCDGSDDGGASGLSTITSPNASIVVVQNTTHANITINVTYLDGLFVGQSEYPSLDTDSTNDLTTATVFGNTTGSRLNVTGTSSALVLTIAANNITGDDILESSLGTVPTATTATTASNANQLGGQDPTFYLNRTGFAAENLTSGTVPTARLSGTYSISISGDAGTLAGQTGNYYLNRTGFAAGNITSGSISTTYTDAKDTTDDSVTGTVDSSEITDGTIAGVDILDSAVNSTKLNITNAGSDGQVLTKAANGQFTWADDQTGGAGGNPFNQSLNTTDRVKFDSVNVTRELIVTGNVSLNISSGMKIYSSNNSLRIGDLTSISELESTSYAIFVRRNTTANLERSGVALQQVNGSSYIGLDISTGATASNETRMLFRAYGPGLSGTAISNRPLANTTLMGGDNAFFIGTRSGAGGNLTLYTNNTAAVDIDKNQNTFFLGNITVPNINLQGNISLQAGGGFIGSGGIPNGTAGCSAGQVLANVTMDSNGAWTGTCVTASGGSDGTGGWTNTSTLTTANLSVNITGNLTVTEHIIQHGVPVLDYQSWFCDFMQTAAATMCYPNYLGAAVSTGGTLASTTGNVTRPGVITLSKGTAVNSGYRFTTDLTAFRINGSERFSMVAGEYVDNINSSVLRAGFLDSITSAAVTDGVYFEHIWNQTYHQVGCLARSNSATTMGSQTNYTFLGGSTYNWYAYEILVAPNGTFAWCNIYNATNGVNTLLWNSTINSGLPNAAGRETGSGIVVYNTATGSAAVVMKLDYLNTEIEVRRRFI